MLKDIIVTKTLMEVSSSWYDSLSEDQLISVRKSMGIHPHPKEGGLYTMHWDNPFQTGGGITPPEDGRCVLVLGTNGLTHTVLLDGELKETSFFGWRFEPLPTPQDE